MAGYSVARHNDGFTTGRGHERRAIRLCWNHCVEPRSGRCADECDHRKTGGSRRKKQTNGDEVLYPNRIGNFSKALPHNDIGEVDPAAYDSLLTALTTGDPSDFAKIPLGGTVKLANPQGGLAFNLQGTDSGQLTIPPAPAVASAERAGEMVEDYWMALTRDIPFSQYGNEPVTAAAVAELNTLSDLRGPKVNGRVTPGTLFRGFTPGDMVGPYISQFLLQPVAFGAVAVGALS